MFGVTSPTADGAPASRRARRVASPRWLDLRLVSGLLLVLLAVVIGARVFASADHYTRVYVAARPLVPGERIAAGDLTVGRIRFDGQGRDYVAASGTLPTGYLVTRYVGSGELVPRQALTAAAPAGADSRLVTVPVEPGHLPSGLGHGDLVDVYFTPKPGAGQKAVKAALLLPAVPVDSTDNGSRGLAGTSSVSVVLAVPTVAVPATIQAVETGTIDLVTVPESAAAVLPSPGASPASPASSASTSASSSP
jgi:hypothetical protein